MVAAEQEVAESSKEFIALTGLISRVAVIALIRSFNCNPSQLYTFTFIFRGTVAKQLDHSPITKAAQVQSQGLTRMYYSWWMKRCLGWFSLDSPVSPQLIPLIAPSSPF